MSALKPINIRIIKKEAINPEDLNLSKRVDEDSAKGRFGWSQIMTNDIPYLYRSGKKYVCFSMLEKLIFRRLFSPVYNELKTCSSINLLKITDVEAWLLTEINTTHCNFLFGHETFTTQDFLLDLDDIGGLCDFLNYCYMMINSPRDAQSPKRCGFIKINQESVVPYTTVKGQRYVPTFYFEGDISELRTCTMKIDKWELAYLKFCCKIQGIRNDLIIDSWCEVVNLTVLIHYFPSGSNFMEFWPIKTIQIDLKKNANYQVPCSLNSLYNMNINVLSSSILSTAQTPTSSTTSTATADTQKKAIKLPLLLPKVANTTLPASVPMKVPAAIIARGHDYMSSTFAVYKLQYLIIQNCRISCINMKPNDYSDKWVPVIDLSMHFFAKFPVHICEKLMNVLGIEVYRANNAQMKILKRTGKYNLITDAIGLVEIQKFIKHWPQLTYMIKNIIHKHQSNVRQTQK